MLLFWSGKDESIPLSSTPSSKKLFRSDGEPEDDILRSTQHDSPPLQQTAPLLELPIELLHIIATYLDPASAASFSLSARYVCYAIGRSHVSKFLFKSRTRFERREKMEIIERAFPSHWYCAWCDKFHACEALGGPKVFERETKRACATSNSRLRDYDKTRREAGYVLAYHHVRLAVNRVNWGKDYGIGLDKFEYERKSVAKMFKTKCPITIRCEAKVVSSHFLLHSSYNITLPSSVAHKPDALLTLWPTLPHIVVGHRDSNAGHTGLSNCLENTLTQNWKYHTQLCFLCATDYVVSCRPSLSESNSAQSQVLVEIEVWRDLGAGRDPFYPPWRSHGENSDGMFGSGGELLRLANLRPGEIRKAYEKGGPLKKVSESVGAGPRAANPWHERAASNQYPEETLAQQICRLLGVSAQV